MKGSRYKSAGVDIDTGARLVEKIKPLTRSTKRIGVIGELGGFGGLFDIGALKYKHPILVSGTDSVGTKLKIALMAKKLDTIGVDLVAMSVNDVVAHGAEPLFFLDYLACGKLKLATASKLISGIVKGCKEAGCALLGGETAEMPGFYAPDEYELVGFAVGAVEKDKLIDGSKIKAGDQLIGFASNGLHSNGYSLVRKVLFEELELKLNDKPEGLSRPLGRELLRPTRIYIKAVLAILKKHQLKGIAHITGGGIIDNVARILPGSLRAEVKWGSWKVQPIFKLIEERGRVSRREMLRTFNMGIGMIVVADKNDTTSVLRIAAKAGEKAMVMGEVKRGSGGAKVEFVQ